MMTPVSFPRLRPALIGALLLASIPAPMWAQDGGTRLVQIRRVIELDEDRLAWLRRELRSRKERFEELATTLTQVAAERDEIRGKLELIGAGERPGDAARADALRTELEELEEDFRLVKAQTDLALEAERIVRQQIEALETKIEKERLALGRLTGDVPATVRTSDEEASAPSSTQRVSEASPTPPDVVPASQSDTERSSSMTAAQLQAQKILEQSELEVQVAEQELSEVIERKQALEDQIDFEKQLLEGDDKQREHLETALAAREDRMQRYRAENASEDKIARRERTNRRLETILDQALRSRHSRVEYIESLKQRLAHLEEAELRITEEVDEAQAEAHRVRRRVKWLQSPLHPQNIAYWAKRRGPRIVLVIVAAALLLLFLSLTARRMARAVVRRRRDDRDIGSSRDGPDGEPL